jgi:hypothetical protein
MTIDEILSDLENKVFHRSVTLQESPKAEHVILENECTEFLTRLLAFLNKRCLRNFSLRLEMEVKDNNMEFLGGA